MSQDINYLKELLFIGKNLIKDSKIKFGEIQIVFKVQDGKLVSVENDVKRQWKI